MPPTRASASEATRTSTRIPIPTSRSNPTPWLLFAVPAPPRGQELLVVDALRGAGARAVEPEGGRLLALLPAGEPGEVARRVERALRSTPLRGAEVDWRWLSEEEWLDRWWTGREALRVGRFRIVPTGADRRGPASERGPEPLPSASGEAPPREVVIRLDPGAAFGTAEHSTTRACLRWLARLGEPPGEPVLDVGAGSAVLAIAAALLGARRVLALESDPVACDAARRNVRANGVSGRVVVREREVRPGRRLGRHDLLVANLQAPILLPLLPTLARATRRGGRVVLAGVLAAERAALDTAVDAAGLEVVEDEVDDGWWSGLLRHRCTPGRRLRS